jgi:hypothetical protein
MKKRMYIQLGRVGDILNVLPLCRRDFIETGVRPVLMVAEKFCGLLDGVTYVEPFVFGGRFEDISLAYDVAEPFAEKLGVELVCTQIYGEGLYAAASCSSFLREAWARDPRAPAWGTLPLVFDRRDPTREAGVSNQLMKRSTGKPYIVLALSGTSSPFPENVSLSTYLRNKLGKTFDFVDVSGFIAPRFYDLLALLEGAHALVTVDSGLLHLAAALPSLDVFAFVTRWPSAWHGSAWRAQHAARFYYDEAPECFASLVDAILRGNDANRPSIQHAWTHFTGAETDETNRRNAFARSTWRSEYATGRWIDREFAERHSSRSSADLGDPCPIPFMRDVIDHADSYAAPDDLIAWTNADSCFTPGLTGRIVDVVSRTGCAYTHRWDFYKPFGRPLRNEAEVKRGEWYMGTDACFFTARWWRRHRDEYPDLLVGREQNDEILRQLIKRHGGLEIPAAIYHEKHASFWEHAGNREQNPGNAYNRRLAVRWFLRNGYGPNDWRWWAIPESPFDRAVDTGRKVDVSCIP